MPEYTPAAPVVLATVLRKSRRVSSDSDDICHLLLCSELPVRLGNPGLRRISGMDEHAVAEKERVSCRNGIPPVLTAVTGKRLEAEGIRRQQTVRAGVPVRGRSQVMWVLEDRDTDILAR